MDDDHDSWRIQELQRQLEKTTEEMLQWKKDALTLSVEVRKLRIQHANVPMTKENANDAWVAVSKNGLVWVNNTLYWECPSYSCNEDDLIADGAIILAWRRKS